MCWSRHGGRRRRTRGRPGPVDQQVGASHERPSASTRSTCGSTGHVDDVVEHAQHGLTGRLARDGDRMSAARRTRGRRGGGTPGARSGGRVDVSERQAESIMTTIRVAEVAGCTAAGSPRACRSAGRRALARDRSGLDQPRADQPGSARMPPASPDRGEDRELLRQGRQPPTAQRAPVTWVNTAPAGSTRQPGRQLAPELRIVVQTRSSGRNSPWLTRRNPAIRISPADRLASACVSSSTDQMLAVPRLSTGAAVCGQLAVGHRMARPQALCDCCGWGPNRDQQRAATTERWGRGRLAGDGVLEGSTPPLTWSVGSESSGVPAAGGSRPGAASAPASPDRRSPAGLRGAPRWGRGRRGVPRAGRAPAGGTSGAGCGCGRGRRPRGRSTGITRSRRAVSSDAAQGGDGEVQGVARRGALGVAAP